MFDAGLEQLKELLRDDRPHIEVGEILKVVTLKDDSMVRCEVICYPDNFKVVATMTWEAAGPESGSQRLPVVGDWVLVAFAGGEEDNAYIIRKLSSAEDKLPPMVKDGHEVLRALAGKKLYLGSTVKTLVQKLGSLTDPTENVVLGQELKTLLIAILAELATLSENIKVHTHIGNAGIETSPPNNAADFTARKATFNAQKASPVEDEKILSDIFFTEKGN